MTYRIFVHLCKTNNNNKTLEIIFRDTFEVPLKYFATTSINLCVMQANILDVTNNRESKNLNKKLTYLEFQLWYSGNISLIRHVSPL